MTKVRVQLPGPLLGVRLGGPLGPGGLAALAAEAQRESETHLSATIRRQLRQTAESQREQVRSALAALEDARDQLLSMREQLRSEAPAQLVELALAIAEKVVMRELADGRIRIEPMVKEAMLRVPPRQEVIVHLNPADHSQCEIARQTEQPHAAGRMRFVADPSVERGQCILETDEGVIESSVADHLASVAEALKEPEA